MAADSSGTNYLRRALVSSVLALVPRCRRIARRARPGGRPYDDLAVVSGVDPKMRQLAKHLFTVNGERCYDVVKTEVFCGVQGAGGTVSMQVVLQ